MESQSGQVNKDSIIAIEDMKQQYESYAGTIYRLKL